MTNIFKSRKVDTGLEPTDIAALLAEAALLHPAHTSFSEATIAKTKQRDAIFARLDAIVIDLEERALATDDMVEALDLRQRADLLRRDINHAKYTK